MIEIKEANTQADITTITNLANIILPEYYNQIMPVEHVNYFLNQTQSKENILQQIKTQNYKYFLLYFGSLPIGYLGIQVQDDFVILSKLYILKECRGQKAGKAALEYVDSIAKSLNISTIQLTVHRNNQAAVSIYEKKGYQITKNLSNCYEGKFTIEGIKMEKSIIHI